MMGKVFSCQTYERYLKFIRQSPVVIYHGLHLNHFHIQSPLHLRRRDQEGAQLRQEEARRPFPQDTPHFPNSFKRYGVNYDFY